MSEKNPTVSVIIPTYNRAHLIGRAIQSVLNQTYRDFEIIIVDDGSTDNTEEVIKEFQKRDERIRYIKHERNKGYPKALNTGIKAAKGEYIAFQDDDDEWLPEKLEKQMRVFENAPAKVGVVYTGFWRIENNKKIYIPFFWVKQKEGNIHEELLKGNFIGTPAALVRKECFEKVGGFDTKLPYLQDWELWIRISKCYQFRYIDSSLLNSFYTPDSLNYQPPLIRAKTMKLILSKHFNDFAKNKKLLSGHYFSLGVNLYYSSENFEEGKNYLIKAVKIHYLSCSPKGARYALNVKVVNKCSIIIPVFNNSDYIKQYLDVLYTVTPNHLFELIIVNNASTDGTKEYLNEFAKTYPNVKVIHNQENLIFAKAYNQGAKIAEGKYLVFLNNDTVPLKGWLEEMIKVVENDKKVGIVGSKLLYPNRTIQHAGIVIADSPHPIFPYHIYRGYPPDIPEANVVREYQAVTGACMLIYKKIFDKLGGFDEGFLNGYEDVDLCFRVREAGYRVIYTPKSVLYHFESVSEGRFKAVKANEERLQQKWAGKIKADVIIQYPKVSIVILNYNGSQDTIKCLNSVYEKIKYKKCQVIIVDNGSKKEDILKLKEWIRIKGLSAIFCDRYNFQFGDKSFEKEILLINNKENLGFAGGNNIGIRYALKCGADYIWLLNNDAVVEKDSLESSILLAERLKAERQEKVGLISSKIYCYKDRAKVQYNGGKPFYKGIPDKEGELPRSVKFAPCCSLLINRKLLEEIGLLNEDYFLYYEDTEFCIRTLKAGWTIWYNPYSKVYHKGGASIGLWLQSPLSAYYATRNILLCQFQVNPSKVVEIFAYLKNSHWNELKKAPECIFGFIEGIKDFIKGRKGEKDLRPKKIEACLKKVKDTPLQTSGELEERLETSGNLLILNPEKKEVLEQFVNIAQSLFFRNYARLSMGNKNI